jgi:type I restriction enzyme S subunit
MILSDYVEMNPRVALIRDSRVPFVSMDVVKPGTRFIYPREERFVRGSGSKFYPGDTLFARITPCLENGKIAQYAGDRPGMGSTEFFVLRARNGISDPSYVFYFSQRRDLRSDAIRSMSGASGRQRAVISALSDFECEFPPLEIQRRIAHILSAYDELIENSQQRIKILESMARALYREWFVYFRYPGYESVPLVLSALGEIPQGWEVKPMADCIEINPKVVVPRNGEKPFVPMGCLSNDSMQITNIESREGNSGAKFQNNDTLFARITPCLENGKTGLVQFLSDAQDVAFGSTELIVLRSRTLTPEYVYLLARSDDFRSVAIKSMSGATGRQRVQQECFEDMYLAQPPLVLLDQFSAITTPAFRLVYQLHLQIENLRRTRDLLLSRLLSGQIDVDVAA